MKQSVPGHWKSAVKGTSCLLKSLFSAIVGLRPSGNGNKPKARKRSTGYKLFSLEAFKEQATKLPHADGQPGPGSKVPPCGPSAGGGSTCQATWRVHNENCDENINRDLWCCDAHDVLKRKLHKPRTAKLSSMNFGLHGFATSCASCKLLMSIVFIDSWRQFDRPNMPRKPRHVNVTTTNNVQGIRSRAGLPAAVSVKSIWTPKSLSVSESWGSKMRFSFSHSLLSLFVCGNLQRNPPTKEKWCKTVLLNRYRIIWNGITIISIRNSSPRSHFQAIQSSRHRSM